MSEKRLKGLKNGWRAIHEHLSDAMTEMMVQYEQAVRDEILQRLLVHLEMERKALVVETEVPTVGANGGLVSDKKVVLSGRIRVRIVPENAAFWQREGLQFGHQHILTSPDLWDESGLIPTVGEGDDDPAPVVQDEVVIGAIDRNGAPWPTIDGRAVCYLGVGQVAGKMEVACLNCYKPLHRQWIQSFLKKGMGKCPHCGKPYLLGDGA